MTLEEIQFLKQMNLSLPRLCPNCRHYSRLALRNRPKFYTRQWQCAGSHSSNGVYKNSSSNHRVHENDKPCTVEFETSYLPQSDEIVYCEQCYLTEIV